MSTKPQTVREVLLYNYAKLIASRIQGVGWQSVCGEEGRKRHWGLVWNRYTLLKSGALSLSSSAKEFKMLVEGSGTSCVYCGSQSDLEWDHIIPLSRGGPDVPENLVRACGQCNRTKGNKTPSEYYEGRWDKMPRVVQGLYLKLLYREHERRGTLDATEFPEGEKPRISTLALVFSDGSVPQDGEHGC